MHKDLSDGTRGDGLWKGAKLLKYGKNKQRKLIFLVIKKVCIVKQ